MRLGVPWAASILAGACSAVALGAAASARVSPAETAAPDFGREVQPILAASCVRCHGRGESKASLRLDTAAYFHIGGESGAIVVPGDPAASLLIARITNPDPKQRMPHEADPLPASAIETLRRWIEAGAPWPEGVTVAVAEAREATLVPREPSRRHDASRLRYNRDVRPILAESCFPCHGPDGNSRKAGLRLDREEVAKGTLASGTVPVVAGAPERSGVIARVLHPDEASRMPLAKSGRARLRPEQVATLRRWIEEGAEWEPHWAYIPPVREEPSATRDGRWARNPVDAFVLAGIEAAGLRPSPEASRAELLRRLSFDLTGLPPSPAELRSLRARRAAGRLRATGGPPARVAALRRADGPLLARPRALLGQRRLPQRQRAADVALPRLGGLGVQPQPHLRPLHARPARRRPAAGSRQRRAHRLGLQPPAADDRGGRRSAEGVPRHLPLRPRAQRLGRVAGGDARAAPSATTTSSTPTARATSTPSPPSSPT